MKIFLKCQTWVKRSEQVYYCTRQFLGILSLW